MRHFLSLQEVDVSAVFALADAVEALRMKSPLAGKSVVLFMPQTSLHTRVTFEKAVALLGGQSHLFAPETLDKREDIRDVLGYLALFADAVAVRHHSQPLLTRMAACDALPVISAMTDEGHPVEILSDLYALSQRRRDWRTLRYVFFGAKGNIALAWRDAASALGLSLSQCCPNGFAMEGVEHFTDPELAVCGADVILTDSLPAAALPAFAPYRVTRALLERAAPDVLFDPCPPFYRGEEVAPDAIDSPYFVGYGFKQALLPITQAVLLWCLQGV